MPSIDREALVDVSEFVDIEPRVRLEEPGRPPEYVYFLESGMASLLYMGRGDHVVEVAVVGSRGCTGCPSILGVKQSQHGTTMQISGAARRIKTAAFEAALDHSVQLRLFLLKWAVKSAYQGPNSTVGRCRLLCPERAAESAPVAITNPLAQLHAFALSPVFARRLEMPAGLVVEPCAALGETNIEISLIRQS